MDTLRFPDRFLWGTATASHQVEGDNSGNDWWTWEQALGHIWDDQPSGLACDWWRCAEDDLALAAEMGQNTHRLSLEWSRIEPEEGVFDEATLARYRRLLQRMHELGLRPMVTLHHFTNPLWLAAQGGWLNRKVVFWFERYTAQVVQALGDLTPLWCTINEPNVYATLGYIMGKWPPGKKGAVNLAMRVMVHMAAAHGVAYRLLHRHLTGIQVGFAHHAKRFDPARPQSAADRRTARWLDRAFNTAVFDAFRTGQLGFPLSLTGGEISQAIDSLDFVGLNYYSRNLVSFKPGAALFEMSTLPDAWVGPDNWGEINADYFYQTLMQYGQYGKPVIVTENGIPDADDSRRPRFLIEHLRAVHRAIQDGIDVRGYYFWSLVDNFEWAEGYDPRYRFGLIGIDPQTRQRQVKPSGKLYADICRRNSLDVGGEDEHQKESNR